MFGFLSSPVADEDTHLVSCPTSGFGGPQKKRKKFGGPQEVDISLEAEELLATNFNFLWRSVMCML